jgi:ABC-type polysaccharide/polyol phosphate transport system ATPase subunit
MTYKEIKSIVELYIEKDMISFMSRGEFKEYCDNYFHMIKTKNDALLNIKHDNYYVRKCCEKILKGED